MKSLGHPNRITSPKIGPHSREILALDMMLALCLVIFVVLTTGEALAAEGPSQTTQQGTVQSMTTINGKVAEPVAEKTPPVETAPVETPPVQTPPPPTDKTSPAEEEPSPPPVDRAPLTPEPEPVPASQPAPQWFAVVITEGETVESEPVLTTTYWSTTDPEQASDVTYPAPDSATPLGDSGSYVPSTSTDAGAPGYAVEEDAVPTDQWASEPVLGSVASDQVAPERAAQYPESVISPGTDPQSVLAASLLGKRGEAPIAVTRPSTVKPAPAFPASVGGAPPLPSSLGTTAASAVGTVKNAAASVASATAEVLGALASGSPGTSTTDSTDGTQGHPSDGTPQPAPAPLVPPVGSGLFSLSAGGGHVGAGGSFAPLLVGILALLTVILLRRDFRRYLASCEMPKPSSALLSPLERPG